ncbi:hypothetical protein ASE63_22560 [Bosea sp. Root381]|uniref:hypothetical protein n=1 Tax=Bosea sp. Root381 TaxID=1736524 RepID=UPI000715CE27|nr:hypothetical protein [Bosea sp. Root381]KRE07484.1 hypothetical protein ASE63_22560 [Bosea sp. Root381]
MSRRDEPPDPGTRLIDYPWVVIRFRCHFCERGGNSRLAACVAQFGRFATLDRLLHAFMSGCPHDPYDQSRSPPQKYGRKCGAYLPDLNSGRPPDHPPSMTGLSLIEGGKADMLPAEPAPVERRRRVGDADV